tara:strand:+ start:3247 stop:3837 length:591 start_codon:yes stop_codon:yes gene_type:complete
MTPMLGIMASQISGHLVPPYDGPYGAFDSLATVTLSATTASITFAGIPSGYKHLQIRAMMLTNTTGVDAPYLRYNENSAANYTLHTLLGEGISARAQGIINMTGINIGGFWNGTIGSFPSVSIIDVLDYSSVNKYKTTRAFAGQDNNSTLGSVGISSGLWRGSTGSSTEAIHSITIYNSGSTTFSTNSSFALYGVK